MGQSWSQPPQIVWNISGEFCPRLIVLDGLTLSVSDIATVSFTGNILWFPSSVKILSTDCLSEPHSLNAVVFEKGSQFERIPRLLFSKTGLHCVRIPASVQVLCEKCFYECRSLSSVIFEAGIHRNWLG
jgi:hypothetical protein